MLRALARPLVRTPPTHPSGRRGCGPADPARAVLRFDLKVIPAAQGLVWRGGAGMVAETEGDEMTGFLTTHVLDTARGCPAAGLKIALYRIEGEARGHVRTLITNADGRTDEPILPAGEFGVGVYELVFHAGDYLRGTGQAGDAPLFLDLVPIRFEVSEATHYHVPLLLSPFGYSTYRGS